MASTAGYEPAHEITLGSESIGILQHTKKIPAWLLNFAKEGHDMEAFLNVPGGVGNSTVPLWPKKIKREILNTYTPRPGTNDAKHI